MNTTTIKQTVFISASPTEVYKAFVDPKMHSAFTGSKAIGKPKVGGKFTAWDGYITTKYKVMVYGKQITQEWKTSEWPEGYDPSELSLTFTPKANGTEITMMHAKVPEEQAEDYRMGWTEHYWEPLKKYFKEHHKFFKKK